MRKSYVLMIVAAVALSFGIQSCVDGKKEETVKSETNEANDTDKHDQLWDEAYREKWQYARDRGISLADLHVHLKKGLTMQQALDHASVYDFTYGIAFNCGLKMGFESDDSLRTFVRNYEKPEGTYLAMQAEGREWTDLFTKETIAMFDYVFTDSMTWTNDDGQRMRLWIPEETFVGDPEDFMDQMVDRLEGILNTEPVDIYVNATYLPDELISDYDALWTVDRMDRVIKALRENGVAMEISARYKIPSASFIKRAKEKGVKFTFGTNNTGPDDLGRLEYCLEMVKECDLQTSDIWTPSKRPKDIIRRP